MDIMLNLEGKMYDTVLRELVDWSIIASCVLFFRYDPNNSTTNALEFFVISTDFLYQMPFLNQKMSEVQYFFSSICVFIFA